MLRVLAIVGIVGFVLAGILFAVTMSLAVTINGHSMEPTLKTDDRLFTVFWDKSPDRFNLAEVELEVYDEAGEERAVKRVVGMPGDTVKVEIKDAKPVVTLKPGGQDTTYQVVNPDWDAQASDKLLPCCDRDGTSSKRPKSVVIPDGSYWMIGDNWGGSDDSRTFGFVPSERMYAVLGWRLRPFSKFGPVDQPASLQPLD